MDIKEALMNMDALDDDQWTGDGAPKLDVLSEAIGSKIKRAEVMELAPEFSRDNMVLPKEVDTTAEEAEAKAAEEEVAELDLSAIQEYLEGDPLTEVEFIPFLMSLDPTILVAFSDVLAEQLSAAEAAISLATDLKNRIKLSKAYTANRIKAEVPDISNQEAIQHFIKSQTEARGAKILKTRELLQGVDLKSLDPRAAIDRAMARKTGRGAKRPTRPMMGR